MFRNEAREPPSTPDRYGASARSMPSTTPAGPPPNASLFQSAFPSSTPAGPPPTNIFSTSQFGASNPRAPPFNFGKQSAAYPSSPPKSPPKNEFFGVGSGSFGAPSQPRPASRGRPGIRVPSHSFLFQKDDEEEEDEEEDGYGSEDAEGEEEDDDEDMDDAEEDDGSMDEDGEGESDEDLFSAQAGARDNLRQSKRPSTRQNVASQDELPRVTVNPSAKQSNYDLLSLAKGLTADVQRANLSDPDDIILKTQTLMSKLHSVSSSEDSQEQQHALLDVTKDLSTLWEDPALNSNASLAKSNELAALVFAIHYPTSVAQEKRPTFLPSSQRPTTRQFVPVAQALLNWLNKHHTTESDLDKVLQMRQGFSSHPSYWSAVHLAALRGDFQNVLKLLKGANFEVADSAVIDGLGNRGYQGAHLSNAENAASIAVRLVTSCPAIASNNWDVAGSDWANFRNKSRQAMRYLEDFAEGDSRNREEGTQLLQAAHFGLSQSQLGLSTASRKVESAVPWTVYEGLQALFKLLSGDDDEILAQSADWIEAVLFLTVWWNGNEESTGPPGSLAASRRSIAQQNRSRTVDVTPSQAYAQRLGAALATVWQIDDQEFNLDTTRAYSVGLACIFDDNVEATLQILAHYSLSNAGTVAEVGSVDGWFRSSGILDEFDQSDLMVLSYHGNAGRSGLTKDELLSSYAKRLSQKAEVWSSDGKVFQEGWELAIQVYRRLDNPRAADEGIEQLLKVLSLQSADRVDKVMRLCHALDLDRHASSVAQVYADHLREHTKDYGSTLYYYARAHDAEKIQEVLRVLVAHCLIKSIAYPPVAELDDRLATFVNSPKQSLTEIATTDSEAASILSNYLSGYATIRRFYDLRDEGLHAKQGAKPKLPPAARKRAAAETLMVILASAASSIRGGLYDPEAEAVVQVDVLLCLLGESLFFVNQPKHTLSLKHLSTLLQILEDITSAPSMILSQCTEVFTSAVASAHGEKVASPTATLQKSTSNLTTASSQYSLINSAEYGSMGMSGIQSGEGSTVLVEGGKIDSSKRAWDWRKGFGKASEPSDVLRTLRLLVAKDLGKVWAAGQS